MIAILNGPLAEEAVNAPTVTQMKVQRARRKEEKFCAYAREFP
jgi:hypothetical protein